MGHTAVVVTHRLPCLHKDSQRLATNQHEICGLAERNSLIERVAIAPASIGLARRLATIYHEIFGLILSLHDHKKPTSNRSNCYQ
ncbi:MAG: hypothetical protein FJ390_03765 [Verrucomicrobia bacterium]|nr:hypothetical protein [Verrucomicrobiota bacterium]